MNSILLGVQADWNLEHSPWVEIDFCFLGLFGFEMLIKIFAFGHLFFMDFCILHGDILLSVYGLDLYWVSRGFGSSIVSEASYALGYCHIIDLRLRP